MDEEKLEKGENEFVLHPNYIIRVCGGPASIIGKTTTGETNEYVFRIHNLNNTLLDSKESYCEIIEKRVSGIDDKAVSRKLLKLKRDIFNVRPVSKDLLKTLEHVFGNQELEKLNFVLDQISQLSDLRKELNEVYSREYIQVSYQLREVWEDRNLQTALSYTNPNLFADYNSIYVNPEKKIKAKKRRQLESGLLRYASRNALKTSPLSTFTPVYVGEWGSPIDNLEISFSGELKGNAKVKASLFQFMMYELLADFEKIKSSFPLKLNPSIEFEESKIHLRTMVNRVGGEGRTWGTVENNSQFEISQVIKCVFVALKNLDKKSASVEEIIASVLTLAPKLEAAPVEKIIGQLLSAGMFQVDHGFNDQENLLSWFKDNLSKFSGVDHKTALLAINNIESFLSEFLTEDPAQRIEVRKKITNEVDILSKTLDSSLSTEFLNPAFFEDSYIVDKEKLVDKSILQPFMGSLQKILEISPILDVHHRLQSSFADFFLSRFGEDGECTEANGFITEFANLYNLGSPGADTDISQLAPDSSITLQGNEATIGFAKFLVEKVLDRGDSVVLDDQDIDTLVSNLPVEIRNRGASHSILGQFVNHGEKLLVINNVFSGHSGMLSRFLEVLSEEELAKVRDYLTEVSRDGVYSEVSGLFGFTANKHPRMSDNELVLPPFASSWGDSSKIELSDLGLVYDKATHKVFLKMSDGRLMDSFYHGFLMPLLLPKMHCALTMLNSSGVLLFLLPLLRSGRFSSNEKIHFIPRVLIGNTVLVRRSYLIPRQLLPDAQSSEVVFFEAMRLYIDENKLPLSGFIRVAPFDIQPGTEDIELNENVDFKNMKPFYVNFENPRLVQLLQFSLRRSDFPIVITESLPETDDQSLTFAGNDHVSELHFEITKKPLTTELGLR
ncbi:MAG: hypothetical protein ACI9SP_000838 [Arenicella sp.]|jgi:hypothetical protein